MIGESLGEDACETGGEDTLTGDDLGDDRWNVSMRGDGSSLVMMGEEGAVSSSREMGEEIVTTSWEEVGSKIEEVVATSWEEVGSKTEAAPRATASAPSCCCFFCACMAFLLFIISFLCSSLFLRAKSCFSVSSDSSRSSGFTVAETARRF